MCMVAIDCYVLYMSFHWRVQGLTVSVPFEHKENEIGNSSESSMNEMNRMQAAKPNFQPLGIINRKEKY